jgi:hypothetical protein
VTDALLTISEAVRGTVTTDGGSRRHVSLYDVLTGDVGAADVARALADVTTADAQDILPQSVAELTAPPTRARSLVRGLVPGSNETNCWCRRWRR